MQLPQNPNPDQPSILSLKISKNQQKKVKIKFHKDKGPNLGKKRRKELVVGLEDSCEKPMKTAWKHCQRGTSKQGPLAWIATR